EGAELAGHRLDHRRVGVAERVDRDPTQEVQIGLAGFVGQHRALAADQRQRRGAVVAQQGVAPALAQRAGRAAHDGTTMVPSPSEVNTSSSRLCATRPSTTWAAGTPPRTARRQASIFGTMPLDSVGSSWASSSAVSCEITRSVAGQSAYRPGT